MSKPAFDPSKPYEVADEKPPFDPNAPFEAAEPEADVGPPLSAMGSGGVAPASDAQRRTNAQWEGLNDAMPFARDLDAAALGAAPQAVSEFTTAMAGGYPSWQRVLEAYQARKAAGVARSEQAREDYPADYYKTNIPAAVGAGLYGGLAAEPLVLVGQSENLGTARPEDIPIGMAIGRTVGLAGKAGLGIIKGIAAALGVPLQVAEELFARLGASKLGKMIAGNDPTPEGRAISARAQALKAKINAPGEFQPAPGPEIPVGSPENGRAYDLAQQVEAGRATVGPGPADFSGAPSLEGGIYDESLRGAMQKNVPDFNPSADLLGEVERLKYPAAAAPEPTVDPAKASAVTKKVVKPAEPVVDSDPGVIDHSDVYPDVPVGPPRLGSRDAAWKAIRDASGIENHDSLRADQFYEKWKRGEGPKPPPWQGGEFDQINEILGLKGAKRVSGAREAFDRLMQGAKTWEDVADKIELIRTMPGFKDARVPDAIQDMMLPHPAARSASWNVADLDRQLAEDAAKKAGMPRDWWPNEHAGKDPRRHLRWESVESPEEKEAVWEAFADDSMGMGEANARWRLGEDSRVRPGAGDAAEPPPGVEPGPSPVDRAQQWNDVKRDTAAGMQTRREALVAKAQEYRALLQQAKAIESQNRMEAERLRGAADEARTELENIARGRRATEKVAGAVAGWQAGTAGGPVGKIGAASAGYKIGAPVGLGAEAASAAGQRLSAWAAANAQAWATRSDQLGRVAQWALSGSGGPQAAVRMYMLGRAADDMGEAQ